MAFTVKVSGGGDFEISKEYVTSVKFTTDIPLDSNARTKDVGSTMIIKGKIATSVGGNPFDGTINMAKWSVIPAEKEDSYKSVIVENHSGGIVVRKYEMPNAFVVDYIEEYGNTEGVGTFTLMVKQKKDMLDKIKVEGDYSAG